MTITYPTYISILFFLVLWSVPLTFGIGRHLYKITILAVVLSGKVLGVAFVYVFVHVRVYQDRGG